jgi:hypothetical protein
VSRTRCGILHAAPQSRDRHEHRRLVRPRLCSAPLRKCYALRCVRGTKLPYLPGGAIQIFHSVDGPAWPWKNRCVVIASRSAPGAFAFIHASQVGSR